MKQLNIISGDKFNYLTIVEEFKLNDYENKKKRRFICECICGRKIEVRLDSLRNNKKSSCGCQMSIPIIKTNNSVLTHGLSYSSIYKVWKGIRFRCYTHTSPNYFRYGGRGIYMCMEWYSYPEKFYDWAINNGYAKNLQLDRINNNEGYSPENCRWVTSEINNNNKRNNKKYLYNNDYLTLPQISKLCGIGFPTLYRRINENKLSLEEAIKIPLYGNCKKSERNIKVKLTKKQVIDIYNSNISNKKLGVMYNIHESSIQRIKNGKQYISIIKEYLEI